MTLEQQNRFQLEISDLLPFLQENAPAALHISPVYIHTRKKKVPVPDTLYSVMVL